MMRRKIPALSIVQRMFWSFAGIIMIAIPLIGAISLSQLADVLNHEQEEDFIARARQIEGCFQQGMKQAWQQADNLLLSSFVRNVTSGYSTYNDYELAQYQGQLHLGLELNTVIDGMFLYFPESDFVLSTVSIRENHENFFRYGLKLMDMPDQTLQELIESTTYRKALLVEASYLGSRRKGLLLLQKDVTASENRAAVIGVMLPIDKLLPEMTASFGETIQLTISQAQRGYSYGAFFSERIWERLNLDRDSVPQGEAMAFHVDHERGYALFCDLGYGIRLTIVQGKSGIVASITRVQWTFLIMMTLVFLTSIALVYWMARRNAKPITELLDIIPQPSEQTADEIKRLYVSVTDLVQKEREIRGKMEQTLPEFRRYLIERILTSDEPPDEAVTIAIGIAGLDTLYHRVYMTLSDDEPLSMDEAYVYREKNRWVTVAGMPADVQSGISVHVHAWAELACAYGMADALLPAKERDPSSAEAKQVAEGIARVHAGLSSVAKEMEGFFPEQAMQMGVRREGALFYRGMVENGHRRPQTEELAQRLYEAVVENLGEKVIKTRAQDWLEQVLGDLKGAENRQKDEEMRSRMKEEIARHYLEPDYSLESLATGLGLSASYVSTLINSFFESGFVDMVNMQRVQYAARLLQEEDNMTLDQIAAASGFHSAATFRRVFKKRYDMPPAQWRASMKAKKKGEERG